MIGLVAAPPGAGKLTLTGEILLPQDGTLEGRRTLVTLRGAHHSFHTQTWTGRDGRFRFKGLSTAVYVLSAEIPGLGGARMSVDVSAALADEKGRIHRVLTLLPGAPAQTSQVSVAELSIPKRAWDRYSKAERLLGKGRVDQAVALLEQAVAETPAFIQAINTLGTVAYHREDFQLAESLFRRALAVDHRAYPPLVNLGGALVSQRRFEEAVEVNQLAVDLRPDDPLANSQLGLSLWGLEKPAEAIYFLSRAKELDAAHFSYPQLALAQIYLAQLDHLKARLELEEFLRHHPEAKEAPEVRKLLLNLPEEDSSNENAAGLPTTGRRAAGMRARTGRLTGIALSLTLQALQDLGQNVGKLRLVPTEPEA